jgi:hypothetical protein
LDDGYTSEDNRTVVFTPSYTVAAFLKDNLKTTLTPSYGCTSRTTTALLDDYAESTSAITTLDLFTGTTTDLQGIGHWAYDASAIDGREDTLPIHRNFAANTPNVSLGGRGMPRREVEDAL